MRSNWFGVVLVSAVVMVAPGRASSSPAPPAQPFLGDPAPAAAATAPTLPTGFSDTVAFSGLNHPTAIRFASDGRVFVIEKGGRLEVFDGLSDPSPTIVADLGTEVDDYWDRGLLGLALDPSFPATPYVYLLYTYDAPPGGTAPVWNDACPTPPGPNTDGCVVSGRLVRIQVSPSDQEVGSPLVLIKDQWCQQFPSHSIGDLAFGPDGKLYLSAGEGASFTFADYGQNGNPCADPPGGALTPPTAEGGALRAQSPNHAHGPAVLNGSLLRLDPTTGNAAGDNPDAGAADPNLRRIVAYGFRNPFRFAFRPGTSELWLGDVGWNDWEEINRIPTPPAAVQDYGWPCYEGARPQPGYQSAGLDICTKLYSTGTAAPPYYTYNHGDDVESGDGCPTTQGSVVSAIGFYSGTSYPAPYHGALVFGDHSRECLWTMPLGANGQPDPAQVQVLESNAANPVDVQSGPNGDLYYVDFDGGTIHRISYSPSGSCADGTFLAEYHNSVDLSGPPVLTRCEGAINNNWGTGSPAPGVTSDDFSVRWTGRFTFAAGTYTFTSTADDGIRVYVDGVLRIDDWKLQSATTQQATVQLTAGVHTVEVDYFENTGQAVAQLSWAQSGNANTPPAPAIDTPLPTLTYAAGDPIAFSGHATDAEDGALPASRLSWTLQIHHCTSQGCHVHDVQQWNGVSSGTLNAPDHDYPSHLELILTATDSAGATGTTSVTLDPKTVDLTFRTTPAGLSLVVGSSNDTAPFTRTVIVNSASSVSAPATQQLGGMSYAFSSWSDGGAATHNLTAPAADATYTATYATTASSPPPPPVLPPLSIHAPSLSGAAKVGGLLAADTGGWSGSSPIAFAFAWLRCSSTLERCEVVAGASGAHYRVSAADIGSRIEARVTATNQMGSAIASTNPSPVVPRLRLPTIHVLRRVATPPRPRAHSR